MTSGIGIYGLVFDFYGLGHYVETLPNGQQAVSHGGQGTGIMTHFHAIPEAGDAEKYYTKNKTTGVILSSYFFRCLRILPTYSTNHS